MKTLENLRQELEEESGETLVWYAGAGTLCLMTQTNVECSHWPKGMDFDQGGNVFYTVRGIHIDGGDV